MPACVSSVNVPPSLRIELVGGDVGERQVEVAVAIEVADADAHRVHEQRGAGVERHVGELPAAVGVGPSLRHSRLWSGERSDEVVGEVEVEAAVAVVVEPRRGEPGADRGAVVVVVGSCSRRRSRRRTCRRRCCGTGCRGSRRPGRSICSSVLQSPVQCM